LIHRKKTRILATTLRAGFAIFGTRGWHGGVLKYGNILIDDGKGGVAQVATRIGKAR